MHMKLSRYAFYHLLNYFQTYPIRSEKAAFTAYESMFVSRFKIVFFFFWQCYYKENLKMTLLLAYLPSEECPAVAIKLDEPTN